MNGNKQICMKYINHVRSSCSLLVAFLSGALFTLIYLEIGRSSRLFYRTTGPFNYKRSIDQITSFRSSAFDGCGTWQEAYIERHRAILNGNLPPRYLVSVAVEAGLADRLTGTLTEFFLALFTNRAFQITTYGTLPRFEAAFLTPHINWSRPVDNHTLISNLKFTYRGQRGYTGDRSYGSNVDTKLYWPVYLINNVHKANDFFLSTNISEYPIGHANVTTLFVASNRGRIIRLFDNPYHRSQLFRMGLRPETAAKCAFNFLFSPTDAVRTAMSREFSVLKSPDILKISINIRVGDAVFDPNLDARTTLSPFEPFFNCASTIESFARLPNQHVIWYFTSDSLRLRRLVKERYGEKILTEENLRYVHGDCGHIAAKRYGNCTKQSQDFSIQMSAGQIYAMSMCDYHVVPRISGFGRFAASLSHVWHNIYRVHDRNRACGKADYDPIEMMAKFEPGV